MYNILKLLHILSATGLLTGILFSIRLWHTSNSMTAFMPRMQIYTLAWILPCALFQLASGFTMISLGQLVFHKSWVVAIASGFLIALLSWMSFIYSLSIQSIYTRQIQWILLGICTCTLTSMIFLMVTKA